MSQVSAKVQEIVFCLKLKINSIECTDHCTSCGEGAVCTACQTDWMLLNNICYDHCPPGYYEENNACQGRKFERILD